MESWAHAWLDTPRLAAAWVALRRRMATLALLAVGLPGGVPVWLLSEAQAQPVSVTRAAWPPVLTEVLIDGIDDPERTLLQLRERLASLDPADRSGEGFWLLIAAARMELLLEEDHAAATTLAAAERAASAVESPSSEQRAWLSFMQLRLRAFTEGSTEVLRAMAEARRHDAVAPGTVLACEYDDTESWLLRSLNSLDEAWRQSESLEACAAATGWPHYRALALNDRATLAGRGVRAEPARIAALYDEAYAVVGPGRGRFLRSLIAYSAGTTLLRLGRHDEAATQLARALQASRGLDDGAGIAAALIAQGQLALARGRPHEALAPLDAAEPVLRGIGTGTSDRLITLYTARLEAMTLLRLPALAATLARADTLPLAGTPPSRQAALARTQAAAQAVLGRHAAAYEAMQRAHALDQRSQEAAASAQVLRLQALYDASRRDAEVAALRHAEEAARLSLEAQQATARNLWLALAAAGGLGTAGAAAGWRLWLRRRELAELALRDTLTGLPNRRAIEAYARAQLAQARRLSLPFTVAMIDHDHFKDVNDQHGHATGDALLRAFAQAAPGVLRAPDRLGRWGGEEFLLVLPGTSSAEMPAVFARLRAAFAAATVEGLPSPHRRSFSMGAAEAGAATPALEDLVGAADTQLYRAKAEGRDRLV